ncbi:hypothetical protein CYY_000397 [Polysphondylium violaceum]|uniref:C2H2-type domain-containing protein n=1 Tax=Polysphondylium violaceum TaxID=133409 RepID=A0A8J4Q2W6_9MYCE|nr:hypothetical protein CYY_000397 [Polysphondylium violaceum]
MKDQTLILTPNTATANTSTSSVDSSFGSKKTRVTIKYQNVEETVGWYGNTTPSTIEEAIKTVFQIPFDVRLFLKDQDGDVVAISPTLPAGETFTLFVANKPMASSSPVSPPAPAQVVVPTMIKTTVAPSQSSAETISSSSLANSHSRQHGVDEASSAASVLSNSSFLAEPNSSSSNASSRLPPSPSSSLSSMGSPDQTFKTLDNDVTEINTSDSPDMDSKKREIEEEDDEDDPRKKRKRRKAVEIDRSFKCSMANCQKIYGSENALKMHIKLKHPEYQYLIMQQQTPMSQKAAPIIVNNKLLNFGNHPIQPSQQQSSFQRSPIQQSQQQQQQQQRISTSLLYNNESNTPLKFNTLPDMNPRDIMMLSKQYSQQQQQQQQQQSQQQPTPIHNNNNNNNNGNYKGVLPKLFNNSQVPTSTLKMHLASFLAKEKSNKQQQQQSNDSSIQGLFNSPINKIINSQLMPNNLDPTFFKNFQNQLNTLAASNPSIAQDILNYDIEALSDYIKKQIDHLKVGNNNPSSSNSYDSKYHHLYSYASQNGLNNNVHNNNNQEDESDQEDSDYDYQQQNIKHRSHHKQQQQHPLHHLLKESSTTPTSPTQQKGNLSFLVDKENTYESTLNTTAAASSNRDTCTKSSSQQSTSDNSINTSNFTHNADADVAVASLLGLHKKL